MASQEARNLDFFSTPHQEAIRELLDDRQLAEIDDRKISVFRLVTSAQIRRLLNSKQGILRFSERDLYALLHLEADKLAILEPHLDSVSEGFIVDYVDLPLGAIEEVTVEQLMSADPEHLKAFERVLASDKDGELMNNPGYTALFALPTSALQDFGKAIFQDSRLQRKLKFYSGRFGPVWSEHLDIPNEEVAWLLSHQGKEVQDFYRKEENLELVMTLARAKGEGLFRLLDIPLYKVEALGLANLVKLSAAELNALASFPLETVEFIGLEKYRNLDATARVAVGKMDVEVVRILGIDTLEELVLRKPDRSAVLRKKCIKYDQCRLVSEPEKIDASRIIPENCLRVLNLLSTEKLGELAGEERESLMDSTVDDLEAMLTEELTSKYGYTQGRAASIWNGIKSQGSNGKNRAFILDMLEQGLDPEKALYCLNILSSSDYFFLKRVLDLGSIEIVLIIQAVRAIDNSDSSQEALESLFQKKGSTLNEEELRAFLEERRQELIEELGPWADTSDNPTETLTADEIRSWGGYKAEYPRQTAEWRRAIKTLKEVKELRSTSFLNPPDYLLNVNPAVIGALPGDALIDLVFKIGVPNLREMTHADIMRVLAQKDELLETDVYEGAPEFFGPLNSR